MRNYNRKQKRFFGEIVELPSGKYKVKFMKRLVAVNQHKRHWVNINTLQFAKSLNSQLILN